MKEVVRHDTHSVVQSSVSEEIIPGVSNFCVIWNWKRACSIFEKMLHIVCSIPSGTRLGLLGGFGYRGSLQCSEWSMAWRREHSQRSKGIKADDAFTGLWTYDTRREGLIRWTATGTSVGARGD